MVSAATQSTAGAARVSPRIVTQKLLPQLLAAIPAPWRGTTFNNSNLLGREVFSQRLIDLFVRKADDPTGIATKDLTALGNAEDYLRVASNVSVTLETVLALRHGVDVSRVFTFASSRLPIVAVALTAKGREVRVYSEQATPLFDAKALTTLADLGANITLHQAPVSAAASTPDGAIVLLARSDDAHIVDADDADCETPTPIPDNVDAVVSSNVLVIGNPEKIVSADVLVIRKRMSTPMTTPVAEATLHRLAGSNNTATTPAAPADADVDTFLAHLQTLAGTPADATAQPAVFTSGLSAVAAMWLTLVARGGANVLMASTAYGGSSQLTDLLHARAGGRLVKSTFDIQGDADIAASVKTSLDALAADEAARQLPATMLFIEVPSNPDQKVIDLGDLSGFLAEYRAKVGKDVIVMVDATFAPSSHVLATLREHNPEQPAIVFMSLSKSVSRGMTTAGTVVANHTALARDLVAGAAAAAATVLDTAATPDQLLFLCQNHEGVEARCEKAYGTTVAAGNALRAAVLAHTSVDMPLSYVSPENAAKGFTSSTFSFNLPPPRDATAGINAALAQRYVDLLTVDPLFKPCVSFGQDNGLVYCTVPATSTQGAISQEHKAKQARGGVQLVRLSFPPTIDVDAVCQRIASAVATVYA
eukprot:m.480055 g.480055  ORF g.480055 m.480055 type:complete len:649 (-) comp21679_c0_seq1:238-2184(-)